MHFLLNRRGGHGVIVENNTEKMEREDELLRYATPEGLKAFLAGPYVKGIGKVYASRLADAFGLEILSPDFDFARIPGRVTGVNTTKAEEMRQSLAGLKFAPAVAVMLYSAGLSDVEVEKILSHYGRHAAKALLEDPYDMVENAWKVSFFTADKVGRLMGIPPLDPRRIRGAILTAVKYYAERGNMFATEEQTVHTAMALTGATEEEVKAQIRDLAASERIVISRGGVYLPVYYEAEKTAAEKIAALIRRNRHSGECHDIPATDNYGHPLNHSQREAIRTVMCNPVTVVTGGPGTGKTTTVKGIISLFGELGKKVVLAAPTGRAAKRLSTLAGADSKTLHRLLGYRMGRGYLHKRLDADILVIDEASMLEQVMFRHVLDALDHDTKIVLVGDTHQLPAIGAGDVLNDIIASGAIPVVELTENFRHKDGNRIAAAAESIKAGTGVPTGERENFRVIYEDGPHEILEKVIDLVGREIPARYGVDPKDIQVVTPQQDGELGAKELNVVIQQAVNPDGPEIRRGMKLFRLGDRVMQTSNSSQHDVYNGETGYISDIDEEGIRLEVTFYDGKKQWYGKERMRELTLAYATTVHKLQGSETDYMVLVLSGIHRRLLYRNLLYTGVSRARRLCVLVGEKRAVDAAVRNDVMAVRNSNFKNRILRYIGG